MKTPLLRAHCQASRHALKSDSRLDGHELVQWHDTDHGPLGDDVHHHHSDLRLEILEAKVERLETRLQGVIEAHHLWDGS